MIADLAYRLRALFKRTTVEQELADELRAHLEHAIDAHVARGLTRAEAERHARLTLGGLDQIKEECRDAWGIAFLQTVLQDVRYGLRGLRRAPIFAVTAFLTIALSTAAVPTVFTLAHTLLFRRLPVDRPDELVFVGATRRVARDPRPMSYPDYLTFRDGTQTLAGLAAHYSTAPLFVAAGENAREVNGAVVSSNFFPLLGVRPRLGRFFLENEDRVPDRDRVAVVSESLWRTWFGASPDTIGGSVRINGVTFTIVGVVPESFKGLTTSPSEIYIPTMMLGVGYRYCDDSLAPSCTVLSAIGRLAPGRTVVEAASEMTTLMPQRWRNAPPGQNNGVVVGPIQGVEATPASRQLISTTGAVALVLLIACCANLAGLLMAQGASRTREFAIRLSLGAGRRRIVRQCVTESMVLSAAGGLAGVLLSRGFITVIADLFYSTDAEGHPLHYDFGFTWGVLLSGVAAAVVGAALFSVVPALRIAGRNAAEALVPRAVTGRRTAGRRLLGVQAAVSVALVAVGAILNISAARVVRGTAFESSHIALMRLRPQLMRYEPAQAQQFQRAVMARLSRMPGVESASMIGTGIVLKGFDAAVALPGSGADRPQRVSYAEIGPRYFETLKTSIVRGREFSDFDGLSAPRVAIVNESLARHLWPDGEATDRTVIVDNIARRVVGVVQDIPLQTRMDPTVAFVYVPYWQNPQSVDARIAIRTTGDPAAMLQALVREVHAADPDVPIAETHTLPLQMAGWVRPLRLSATFTAYAAALAMLLTGVGLYGALAFTVARRTREIGVRMALGAERRGVQLLILRDGMGVVCAGAGAGVALAWGATRMLSNQLYGASAADWVFYVVAAGLVAVVGLLACWIPARRAAAVEPLVALRCE